MLLMGCMITACTCVFIGFALGRQDKHYPTFWWSGGPAVLLTYLLAILFQPPSPGPNAMAGMAYIAITPFVAIWAILTMITTLRFPYAFEEVPGGMLRGSAIFMVGSGLLSLGLSAIRDLYW